MIAIATVLNFNKCLKALNISRPILTSCQEETTVHYARMLCVSATGVQTVLRLRLCSGSGCAQAQAVLRLGGGQARLWSDSGFVQV